jgi:iron complex outermembrane recepter protein
MKFANATITAALPKHRLLAMAIALCLPVCGQAQEAAADNSNDEAKTLDAIEVTAQRRTENVQKVPVSVSAIKGENLNAITTSGEDVRVLSGKVPSLYVEGSFGRAFPRFYIRGLGNTDFDLNASQPVSLIYDDIVQENPILKGFPMFDLDRVEVLRGPQGTLFGRNTPAGVVKFESTKPSQEVTGYGKVAYGNNNTLNLEGAIGGGLGEDWSVRLSGLYQHRSDYVDNTFNGPGDDLEGYEESALRFQLMYKPSETFEALANVHTRDLKGTARLFRASIIQSGSNNFTSAFNRDRISIDGANQQNISSDGLNLRMRWDLGSMNLYSITGYESAEGYSRGDIDGGSIYTFPPGAPNTALFPSESADGLPEHRQITQEFRLESDNETALDWQAGLYYFNEKITVDTYSYNGFGGAQTGFAQQKQDNIAWAVFGSIGYDFTDRFNVRGGVRYTKDNKDFTVTRFVSPFGLGAAGPFTLNPSDSKVNWDLSAGFELSDRVNLYGRIATGFRAPSIQGRVLFAGPAFTINPTTFVADSEETISYELGIKADFWDNRARINADVFYYTVDNQQLIAVGGISNTSRLLNADKTVGQGFEIDAQAYLTDNLLVTLGSSYNDTEIKDPGLLVAICGALCNVTDPTIVVDVDPGPLVNNQTFAYIDGNPLPQAPKWIHNFTARFGVPMGEGEFFIYTDWSYRSEINFFLYESAEFKGKALLEGGLRIGYNWDNADKEISLYGRNITDKVALVGGIDFNNLTGFVNEPRAFGVQFTSKF